MSVESVEPGVRQLRLEVEAGDCDAAVRFHPDVMGMPAEKARAQKAMIDDVEVVRQVVPRIRVAFEVDTATTTDGLVAGGVDLVAPPTEAPWRSLISRRGAPASLHVTVFRELDVRHA